MGLDKAELIKLLLSWGVDVIGRLIEIINKVNSGEVNPDDVDVDKLKEDLLKLEKLPEE